MAKKKIIRKLKNKYRFIIYNDGTFSEVFSLRLSLLNTYVIVVGCAIIFISLGIILATSTPLQHFFSGGEYKIKAQLNKSALLADSLQNILRANEIQYKRIHLILNGQDSLLQDTQYTAHINTTKIKDNSEEINYVKSSADSALRATVEAEDRFNITHGQTKPKEQLFNLYLYPPINNGVIVATYEKSSLQQYGIEIAAQKDAHVMATAEGTIINASWSVENNFTIIIQHENNLISCYKNVAKTLKPIGSYVERGEAIAIIENIPNQTSGAHLRFELWHKGKSLNPLNYISF